MEPVMATLSARTMTTAASDKTSCDDHPNGVSRDQPVDDSDNGGLAGRANVICQASFSRKVDSVAKS